MTRPTTPPAATVHIPGLLTRTEGNSREHYWTANRRAKQQRGTTSLACRLEGRRCITIERDPNTVEIARRRIEAMPTETARGQTALFEGAL